MSLGTAQGFPEAGWLEPGRSEPGQELLLPSLLGGWDLHVLPELVNSPQAPCLVADEIA